MLLDSGADPTRVDDRQRTPFFIAAENGYDKVVKLLLDWDKERFAKLYPTVEYREAVRSCIKDRKTASDGREIFFNLDVVPVVEILG